MLNDDIASITQNLPTPFHNQPLLNEELQIIKRARTEALLPLCHHTGSPRCEIQYAGTNTSLYESLPQDDSIRLLYLHPGKEKDVLSCSLYLSNLQQSELAYEALSYSWGSLKCSEPLICSNLAVSVTASLRDALLRLRFKDRNRVLWVDA